MHHYKFYNWLKDSLSEPVIDIMPLAGDLSKRKFFRVITAYETFILMQDEDLKNLDRFVTINALFNSFSLKVPTIKHIAKEQGMLLMSDFGKVHYYDMLKVNDNVDLLYDNAIDCIVKLATSEPSFALQDLNLLFEGELAGFQNWFLTSYLKINLTATAKSELNEVFALLLATINSQPQITCHRDFHSKNLMVLDDMQPGILDFQDAAKGPLLYDIVSLLNDCYIDWPKAMVENKIAYFQKCLNASGKFNLSQKELLRWFDFTAVQRHLKNLGTFTKYYLTNGNKLVMSHIPRLIKYLHNITANYAELDLLRELLPEPNLQGISSEVS